MQIFIVGTMNFFFHFFSVHVAWKKEVISSFPNHVITKTFFIASSYHMVAKNSSIALSWMWGHWNIFHHLFSGPSDRQKICITFFH
jgi:hypothetical protein